MSKEIVLVLGMFRSATSLTANILVELGYYPGSSNELLPADKNNEKGYFELSEVNDLNNRIFVENLMTWRSIREKETDLKTNDSIARDIEKILIHLKENSVNKNIVFKEPRFSITEPLWRDYMKRLNLKERIIIVFRNPHEVALSLKKRNGVDFIYALKLWYYYNCSALKGICGFDEKDYIIINHNDYFYDSEFQFKKIAEFLNISEFDSNSIKEVVDLKLYHNKTSNMKNDDNKLELMVNELYRYMLTLSNGIAKLDSGEVDRYCSYLEEIDSSFEEKKMNFAMFKENKWWGAKEWCYYVLYHYKEMISEELGSYFDKKNINSVSLYGNGFNARMLYPILLDNGININKIYDKTNRDTIKYGNTLINVYKFEKTEEISEEIIINTVVDKHEEIVQMLNDSFKINNIIPLHKIIYEIYTGMEAEEN